MDLGQCPHCEAKLLFADATVCLSCNKEIYSQPKQWKCLRCDKHHDFDAKICPHCGHDYTNYGTGPIKDTRTAVQRVRDRQTHLADPTLASAVYAAIILVLGFIIFILVLFLN